MLYSHLSDNNLIDLYQKGDETAFLALYHRHLNSIKNLAYYSWKKYHTIYIDESEFHSTYLLAFAKCAKQFKPDRHSSFGHYFRLVGERDVQKMAKQVFRYKDKQLTIFETDNYAFKTVVEPTKRGSILATIEKPFSEQLDEKMFLNMIMENKDNLLTEEERTIALYRLQGYKPAHIAKMLNCTAKHVGYVYSKVINKMKLD